MGANVLGHLSDARPHGSQTVTPRAKERGVVHTGGIYTAIDTAVTLFFMRTAKKMTLAQYQTQYARLREQLAAMGWISEGYVQNRGPGAGGPCYQWTRKVKGKTVSVALSQEQFQWLQEAIQQWRQAQTILREMQRLSRQVIFETVPHPTRRKKLGKKVLGLI